MEDSASAQPPDSTTPRSDEFIELARFGNTLRRLSGRRLELEYRQLLTRYEEAPSSDRTIRLALLLSAPNASFYDIDRATRLLRDVIYRDDVRQPAYSEFAQMLYNLLSERIYSDSDDEPLQSLVDQQSARNDELSEELAGVRAQLAEERERTAALEGQLNALKELEEQLSEDEAAR